MKILDLETVLAATLALAFAACISPEPSGAAGGDGPTARQPVAGLSSDAAATTGTAGGALDPILIIEETESADACVEEGCPEGLFCDWIQGCTDQVAFCCVDEMCGEGRFCDFDAGGVCAPNP